MHLTVRRAAAGTFYFVVFVVVDKMSTSSFCTRGGKVASARQQADLKTVLRAPLKKHSECYRSNFVVFLTRAIALTLFYMKMKRNCKLIRFLRHGSSYNIGILLFHEL